MTHMRKNQGLFSVPVYITSGDPYEKKDPGNSRLHGMQFKTNPQKRGQTADNRGNKKRDFKPLYENTPGGEPYFAANEKEIKIANEQRKKCLQPDGFKYSSPTKLDDRPLPCSTPTVLPHRKGASNSHIASAFHLAGLILPERPESTRA